MTAGYGFKRRPDIQPNLPWICYNELREEINIIMKKCMRKIHYETVLRIYSIVKGTVPTVIYPFFPQQKDLSRSNNVIVKVIGQKMSMNNFNKLAFFVYLSLSVHGEDTSQQQENRQYERSFQGEYNFWQRVGRISGLGGAYV